MSKIGLIIRREYLSKVKKTSFILITLLMPFLIVAVGVVPALLATIESDDAKQIAVIDKTGKYASLFKDTDSYNYVALDDAKSVEEYRNDTDREIYAYLMIDADLSTNPDNAVLYSDKQIPMPLQESIEQTLSEQVRGERLAAYEFDRLDDLLRDSKLSIDVATKKWDEDGKEQESSAAAAMVLGMVLTMLIYMVILIYGNMVMQSVMEEKTNRIVEIMVSSVKPFELMMGKITAIGLVAITQLFIWGVMMTFFTVVGSSFMLSGSEVAEASAAINPSKIEAMIGGINFGQIGFAFIVYFVGGYLIFAALFAAIGGALDQPEDAQQFVTPMMIIVIFALYAGIYSASNPDGPLAFWGSMIPITSPIVMMVRLPYDVPTWELILSMVLLYATAIGIVWMAAKIYRVGILMYGKKPSVKEMIKWLRY